MSRIRRLAPGDESALTAFLKAIPAADRTFIKEEVGDKAVARTWIADGDTLRAVAVDPSGEIVGLVAVIAGVGWSSHVGDLRLVVHPGHRRQGLGTELARWAVVAAIQAGLKKLVVEVVAEQGAAVAMFQSLGFEAEALLKDHVRDRKGSFRDILLLAHRVEGNWSALATLGMG